MSPGKCVSLPIHRVSFHTKIIKNFLDNSRFKSFVISFVKSVPHWQILLPRADGGLLRRSHDGLLPRVHNIPRPWSPAHRYGRSTVDYGRSVKIVKPDMLKEIGNFVHKYGILNRIGSVAAGHGKLGGSRFRIWVKVGMKRVL